MVDCVQSGYGNGRTTGKFCITTLVIRIICADGKSSPWHVMLIDEWVRGSISASDKVFQCVLLFAFCYFAICFLMAQLRTSWGHTTGI